MAVWGIQSLQAGWFINELPQVDIAEVFKAITGAGPDQRQQTIGTGLVTGVAGRKVHRLALQPGRIDYFESNVATATDQLPTEPHDGSVFDDFVRRASEGNRVISGSSRIAIVGSLLMEIDAVKGAYSAAFADFLRFEIGFDEEDFSFQINRPKPFESSSHPSMNRLLKYNVQLYQYGGVDPGGNAFSGSRDVATIEVDVNSRPSPNLRLSREDQDHIWGEIADEAKRLLLSPSISSLA